jgi:hypothetical protein
MLDLENVWPWLKANLSEENLINNVARVTPWLAPLIPASFAFNNAKSALGASNMMAYVIAAAIEFLGLGVVHTAFTLWEYNQTKREKDPVAPTWIMVLMGVFYLTVVILVNILLDLADVAYIDVAAKATLSLISIPAAFVLAIRAQHRHRLNVIDADKVKRQEAHELGMLRKQNGELQGRVKSLLADSEALQAVTKERDRLLQKVSGLEKQVSELEQSVSNPYMLLQSWPNLNPVVQQSLRYLEGEFQSMDEAAAGVTNKTAISRMVKRLDGNG